MKDASPKFDTPVPKAGPLRIRIHAAMLRLDEWICNRSTCPAAYVGLDDGAGAKIHEFLQILAAGRVPAYYDNGLRVPRSLFYSAFAAALLSQNRRERQLVRTPYLYGSARDIVIPKSSSNAPWGPLAPRQ